MKTPFKVVPYMLSRTIAPITMYEMYVTLRLKTTLYSVLAALAEDEADREPAAKTGVEKAAARRAVKSAARCISLPFFL